MIFVYSAMLGFDLLHFISRCSIN